MTSPVSQSKFGLVKFHKYFQGFGHFATSKFISAEILGPDDQVKSFKTYTLPETNSSPLKICRNPKRKQSSSNHLFSVACAVGFREGRHCRHQLPHLQKTAPSNSQRAQFEVWRQLKRSSRSMAGDIGGMDQPRPLGVNWLVAWLI